MEMKNRKGSHGSFIHAILSGFMWFFGLCFMAGSIPMPMPFGLIFVAVGLASAIPGAYFAVKWFVVEPIVNRKWMETASTVWFYPVDLLDDTSTTTNGEYWTFLQLASVDNPDFTIRGDSMPGRTADTYFGKIIPVFIKGNEYYVDYDGARLPNEQ